jgi:F-type H+-transporting ATPase subunit delta
MAELAVVRRYARALFGTAQRKDAVDQVEEDLKSVDQVLRQVPLLSRALRAPTIGTARKQELVRRAFATRVGDLSLRFLALVVDRGREDILSDIYAEFQRLANEQRNLLPVQVTSATELSDAERASLAQAVARRTGKQAVLEVHVDPRLLGGVILRMGDTIIDGSVRTRLNQLKQRLLAGRAV